MEESTLDLITRKLYSREIDDIEAISELKARGWSRSYQWIVYYLLLLVTFPERLICALGGDEWDNGPTKISDIAFSISFSLVIALPLVVAWRVIKFILGLGGLPVVEVTCWFASFVYCKYFYKGTPNK